MSSPSSDMMLPVQAKSRDTTASQSAAPGASALYISPADSRQPLACISASRALLMACTIHIPSSAAAVRLPRRSAAAPAINFLFIVLL